MGSETGANILFRCELTCVEATSLLAQVLAPHLRVGDCVALRGELGVGKTTFARALIIALGVRDIEIPSPSYTLAQSYHGIAVSIWHFDLYRLKSPEEALVLGIDEAIHDSLVLLEWPERLGISIPLAWLEIEIEYTPDEHTRQVTLSADNSWTKRLVDLSFNES